MQLGKRGEQLIKSYEKLRLKAYKPTPNDVWTIGWGHTHGVREGDKITQKQAQAYFEGDVLEAVARVNQLGVPLTQAMFDALVSLAYNAGTLGRTIPMELQNHEYYYAWAAMAMWRKQGGRDLLGLARRRAAEMVLFLEDGIPTVGV